MLNWHDQFVSDTASLGPDEVLLGLDNHGAQQTEKFRAAMERANNKPAYTPPDCTDTVSPCDHYVGARLKHLMAVFYKDDFASNVAAFELLSASDRRMKMATWAAAAWALLRQEAEFIRSAFVSTGFLIAKDGSESHLIQVPGAPDYDFTS